MVLRRLRLNSMEFFSRSASRAFINVKHKLRATTEGIYLDYNLSNPIFLCKYKKRTWVQQYGSQPDICILDAFNLCKHKNVCPIRNKNDRSAEIFEILVPVISGHTYPNPCPIQCPRPRFWCCRWPKSEFKEMSLSKSLSEPCPCPLIYDWYQPTRD